MSSAGNVEAANGSLSTAVGLDARPEELIADGMELRESETGGDAARFGRVPRTVRRFRPTTISPAGYVG